MLRAATQLLRQSRQAQIAVQNLARVYSTATAEAHLPQPPIQVYGTPGRYASALYAAAVKDNKLEEAERELTEIYNLAVQSPDFERFVKDPTIPRNTKAEALKSILDELKFSDITSNFFALLAENNRLGLLDKISDTFDEIMEAVRGEVKATITTAEELSREQLDDIKQGLSGVLKEGESLLLKEKVDPSIIGGFVIDIGDKHIDMSILSRVKKVQQLILETST